jgi:hypothetical protein
VSHPVNALVVQSRSTEEVMSALMAKVRHTASRGRPRRALALGILAMLPAIPALAYGGVVSFVPRAAVVVFPEADTGPAQPAPRPTPFTRRACLVRDRLARDSVVRVTVVGPDGRVERRDVVVRSR